MPMLQTSCFHQALLILLCSPPERLLPTELINGAFLVYPIIQVVAGTRHWELPPLIIINPVMVHIGMEMHFFILNLPSRPRPFLNRRHPCYCYSVAYYSFMFVALSILNPCEILLPPTGHYLLTNTIVTLPNDHITGDFDENFLNLIVAQSAITNTLVIELDTPTIGRTMPTEIRLAKNKRWNSFSATNQVKAHLHQTEHPNALPASWRCPGSPRMLSEVLSLVHPVRLRSWMRPSRLCEIDDGSISFFVNLFVRNTTTTNFSYSLSYAGVTTAPTLSVVWPPNNAPIGWSNVTIQAQVNNTTASVTGILRMCF